LAMTGLMESSVPSVASTGFDFAPVAN